MHALIYYPESGESLKQLSSLLRWSRRLAHYLQKPEEALIYLYDGHMVVLISVQVMTSLHAACEDNSTI